MLNLLLNMHFNISGRVVEQAFFRGKKMTNKWINLEEKKRKEKDTSVFNRPHGNFRFNNLSTPRYFQIL